MKWEFLISSYMVKYTDIIIDFAGNLPAEMNLSCFEMWAPMSSNRASNRLPSPTWTLSKYANLIDWIPDSLPTY